MVLAADIDDFKCSTTHQTQGNLGGFCEVLVFLNLEYEGLVKPDDVASLKYRHTVGSPGI